jgi:hypothetical protein
LFNNKPHKLSRALMRGERHSLVGGFQKLRNLPLLLARQSSDQPHMVDGYVPFGIAVSAWGPHVVAPRAVLRP